MRPWRRVPADEWRGALASVVREVLTPAVTRALPPDWAGPYDEARARNWINDRDAEGTNLLVVNRATHVAIGLVILNRPPGPDGEANELRIGYLLAEHAWGKGFASELLTGLVAWGENEPGIGSLAGGVARDNAASRRVLEKAGFEVAEPGGEELLYRRAV